MGSELVTLVTSLTQAAAAQQQQHGTATAAAAETTSVARRALHSLPLLQLGPREVSKSRKGVRERRLTASLPTYVPT